MTAFTEFFCNLCNSSCQRRDPGDEIPTGYVRVPLDFGMPGTWTLFQGNKGVEHACGRCEASKERFGSTLETRHPALEAVAELAGSPPSTTVRHRGVVATNTEGGWPSRTSPFGATEQPGGVDGQDDGGVHEDGA